MFNATSSNEDSWPLDYILSALQFLSLDNSEKCKYLPQTFQQTLFHGSDGDFLSTSPISTILSIYLDCISVGATWDEWIDDCNLEELGLEQLFLSLTKQPRFPYRNHKNYKSLGCIMLCKQTRHHPLGATKAYE